MPFSSIPEALEDFKLGRMVIVVDDEDRENEGDLTIAAEKVTPEIINFMARYGRGLICLPMTGERLDELRIPLMVRDEQNSAKFGTAFCVPIEAKRGTTTGISAADRARTILTAVDPKAGPEDLARPGHMFPLRAVDGGVLQRAGQTEAAVDLARMAGLKPAGVLIEILNENGDRANRDQLFALAAKHGLEIITIEQLIRHRRRSEKLVYRLAEADLPTQYGPGRIVAYGVRYEDQQPVAIVIGHPEKAAQPLIRLHSSCFTGDLLTSLRCDCGDQLQLALQMIGQDGAGVLVYLPQEGRGIGLVEKIKAYALQDQGMDTVEANIALGHQADSRDYGVGIQVLKDLGLDRVRLLTNNPKKTDAFIYGGFDLRVVDQVPIMPPINEHNAHYLATKRDKLGHRLPPLE